MAKWRGDAAPNPEWVLMYRRGLSRKKIAGLTGAPSSTVEDHIALAKALDPDLRSEHEAAGESAATPGMKRLRAVLAMVEATGRYPSRNADDESERKLAAWLRRRRRDADAGILDPAIRDGLALLPDWQRRPRDVAHEAKWRERLAALVTYRASGHDWPRSKASISGEEHELGVWLRTQRFKERRGKLSPKKAEALDAALPGWRVGRKKR
ncbi:helicase associated domain-containing protein [Arthrobacter sp. Soil736]|uniref:helicase associated domain-containing protein n=1 Tax=Arthrobacter sp. Soil736 TaxID=1736395 RepID=UPI000B119BFF|nr:helicase associated domain-containing protein [Arthrobacter sp. Soil736]